MKIDKTTLKIWDKHFAQLNISKVKADIGIKSSQTLYNALNGNCSQATHDKINNYLLQRKRMLNELKQN